MNYPFHTLRNCHTVVSNTENRVERSMLDDETGTVACGCLNNTVTSPHYNICIYSPLSTILLHIATRHLFAQLPTLKSIIYAILPYCIS